MLRLFLVLFFFTGSILFLKAQRYNTLAGVRISDDIHIVFAQRLFDKHTVEARIGTGITSAEQRYVLLMNRHYPLLSRRFNIFLGAGGFYSHTGPLSETQHAHTGVALNAGAELTLGRLSMAVDYQPLVAVPQKSSAPLFQTSSGLSLRYVLVKRKSNVSKKIKKVF
jgi:hypothetical protein